MADLTEVQPAGVEIRFVGDPGSGYEIQLANHDELPDEALAVPRSAVLSDEGLSHPGVVYSGPAPGDSITAAACPDYLSTQGPVSHRMIVPGIELPVHFKRGFLFIS